MVDYARVQLADLPAAHVATDVVRRLRQAGHQAFWVGGCVRDLWLGLQPKDFDVATSARPEQVAQIFRHIVEVGVAFGVVRVRHALPQAGIHQVEVATFRADLGYSDGRRPDAVAFTDAEQDVLRRDFTINGLLLDPMDLTAQGAQVVDWVGGLADLQADLLRAIGEPQQRFAEDALRMLRAPRFAARFGLRVDQKTAQAIQEQAPQLARVSVERISSELQAMLTAPSASTALRLLADLHLDRVLWPELCAADPGLLRCQNSFKALHNQEVGAPLLGMLAVPEGAQWPLALAVLHQPLRPVRPADLGRSLKLSRPHTQQLAAIWQLADALAQPVSDPEAIRHLRQDWADHALRLLLACAPESPHASWWHAQRQRRAATPKAHWWPVLAVTGDQLLQAGLAPGPAFRTALAAAEDAQLQGGDAATALDAAKAAYARVSG